MEGSQLWSGQLPAMGLSTERKIEKYHVKFNIYACNIKKEEMKCDLFGPLRYLPWTFSVQGDSRPRHIQCRHFPSPRLSQSLDFLLHV